MTRFSIDLRVPWSDVDLAKIVYFPRYLSYFEVAELEWIRQKGWDYEKFLEEVGIWMPRVAAHCNFRAPARLADLLRIEMGLDRLGKTSFTLGFDAYRLPERIRVADGYIAIATVSRTSFRPTPIPAPLLRLLEELEPRCEEEASVEQAP